MDKLEIEKRINYIIEKLETLKLAIKDYEEKNLSKYERYKALKTVERDCEEIIESAVRINQEILSQYFIIGNTYRETFEKLLDKKIITNEKNIEKLASTTGFRNRLAHDYINLDDKITIASAKKILKLYPSYLLKIKDYLNK
ncbi:MAG: type VII toxin-antitoxin system HepT family RNase toxin [Nanoarchaeota archaeon]